MTEKSELNTGTERIEPLFLSIEEARNIIRSTAVTEMDVAVDNAVVETIASSLLPQIWLSSHSGQIRPGDSRLGGVPDLPPALSWPVRAPMQESFAVQWEKHHGWIARLSRMEAPLEFVAQINLSDCTATPASEHLPKSGRLLFFWDGATGVLESGTQVCRVLYDKTPVNMLKAANPPAAFEQMETIWREAAGPEADPALKKPFLYPETGCRPLAIMVLPEQGALEQSENRELSAILERPEAEELYSLLTSNDVGLFTADPDNMRVTQDRLVMESRRNRLMGPPMPEQDDPRFSVLDRQTLPPYPWTDAQLAEVSVEAGKWQMLLQISAASLAHEQYGEGTIYFLIRRTDLAVEDFSRVAAVYQQT